MRYLLLLIIGALPVLAQPFSAGVKGGVPFNDFLNAAKSGNFDFTTSNHRYVVGVQAELRLPFGFGVEFDALYRRFSYNSVSDLVSIVTNSSTSGNAWEFPLLGKYRFKGVPVAKPFVDAGVAWDTLQGVKQSISSLSGTRLTTSNSSTPTELNKKTTTGFVTGVGVDIKALVIHISPEIRYTRWGAKHFLSPNGGLNSNQNQAEFLVGITF